MFALFAVAAIAAAGCARTGTGRPGGPAPGGVGSSPVPKASFSAASAAFDAHAKRIAGAWTAADHGHAWSAGLVPLQDLTILPAGMDDTERTALMVSSFVLSAPLPASSPRSGRIAFPDGATLSVPLQTSHAAYGQLAAGHPVTCPLTPKVPTAPTPPAQPSAPGDPDGSVSTTAPSMCRALHVTHVGLGTAKLWTSRGTATVPAWLFTIDTLPGPIARVAVDPSAIDSAPDATTPPDRANGDLITASVIGTESLVSVTGTTITYRITVGVCDQGIRPLVYETDGAVVLGATAFGTGSVCVAMAKIEVLTVHLRAPVGTRAVLDVASGGPPQVRNLF
ncbi:MAG TPA: hypothetical protein VH442_16410 [Micromonosporaceae bacterium]